MSTYKIYNIIDLRNQRAIYVGATKQPYLSRRWNNDVKDIRNKSNTKKHNYIREHGMENFSIEPIREVDDALWADFYEAYYIRQFNTYGPEDWQCNATPDGKTFPKGHTLSEETKRKLSKSHGGRPFTIDGVEYYSLPQAADVIGIPNQTIWNRLRNPSFPNYRYR